MRPFGARVGLLFCWATATAAGAHAQSYVLRIDSRAQRVAYRGIEKDSLPEGQVVTGPDGGLQTPDGHAAICPGTGTCYFFRPGAVQHGAPLVTAADLTAWGFGVTGLSLRANARAGLELAAGNVWPGTEPAVQLVEGYFEYANERITARLGRQTERSRLGPYGHDGVRLAYRVPASGLTAIGYAGFGLARGASLPVTSTALDPLEDFRPRRRQQLTGVAAEWQSRTLNARLDYEREVDGDTRNFVSERTALSLDLRPLPGWSLAGGADYDLGRGWWGTSDLTLRHSGAGAGGTLGVQRYRPYFDLWSIWGVFSPLPHTAVNGSFWIVPLRGLTLRGGGERYWYPDAEAETPLVKEETRGWRWNAGVGYLLSPAATIDVGYEAAFGPGAATRGVDGSLDLRPARGLTLTVEGGHQVRPLEYRIMDPALTWYGVAVEVRPSERLRVGIRGTRYNEDRRRPDAAAIDWSQTRLSASLSWLLGSSPDRVPLPPAVRRGGRR